MIILIQKEYSYYLAGTGADRVSNTFLEFTK